MGSVYRGITFPRGFSAAGGCAGIKKNNTDDLALIYSETPCVSAGTFTTNLVKAAPVLWDRDRVYSGAKAHAVVCNSGIANACTGQEGLEACRDTAAAAADALNIPAESVLVASTGVIGQDLPTEKIKAGIKALAPALSGSEEAAHAAARAIMTTDTKPKEVGVTFEVKGREVRIGGMCKGSGMIHPNMCTMLSFVTTDISISGELLQKALSEVVNDTYNMISVDGDTSTNDTVLLLANGLAGNETITEEDEGYRAFREALYQVSREQARNIAGDGEGATALVEMHVKNAKDDASARTLAKSVITSNLTKAAIFGHDANWGRILCALGYAGAPMDPDRTELWIGSKAGTIQIFKDGRALDYSEEEATKILSEPEVVITADMHIGDTDAIAYGCDLTYDYIKINADYRS